MDFFSEAPATLPSLSLCALWIVACAIPAYLLLERRMGSGQQASVPLSSAPVDPLLDRELRFYRSVEELCDEFKLTGREREMLREVLHGYSIDSIAQRHSLSTSTVKTYLGRAYGRFGINSRQAFLTLLDSRADDGERVQAVGRSLRSS